MKLNEELKKKKIENKNYENEDIDNMNNIDELIRQNPEFKEIIEKLNKKDT